MRWHCSTFKKTQKKQIILSLVSVRNILCSILPISYTSAPYSSSYISRSYIQHDPTIRNGVGFAEYGPPTTPARVELNYNVPVAPNNPEQYKFGFIIVDPSTGDFKSQEEVSVDGLVQGQFSLLQPDGFIRNVFYTADDQNGFNAVVKTYPAAQVARYPTPFPPLRSREDGDATKDPCKRLTSKLNKLGMINLVENFNNGNDLNISKTETRTVNGSADDDQQTNLADSNLTLYNNTTVSSNGANKTLNETNIETKTTTLEIQGVKLSLADVLECAFSRRPCLPCYIVNDLK